MQQVDGGFARVGVFFEGLPGGEGDERLPSDVLVTAVHSAGVATAAHAVGGQQVLVASPVPEVK